MRCGKEKVIKLFLLAISLSGRFKGNEEVEDGGFFS